MNLTYLPHPDPVDIPGYPTIQYRIPGHPTFFERYTNPQQLFIDLPDGTRQCIGIVSGVGVARALVKAAQALALASVADPEPVLP